MEILGIGPSELVFIILIAIIILGPRDMQKAGKTIGRFLNKLIHSEGWQIFQKTSTEMRNLPTRLMREANLEMQEAERDIRKAMDMQETNKEIREALDLRQKPTASVPSQSVTPPNEVEPTIQPPTVNPTPESIPDTDQHE